MCGFGDDFVIVGEEKKKETVQQNQPLNQVQQNNSGLEGWVDDTDYSMYKNENKQQKTEKTEKTEEQEQLAEARKTEIKNIYEENVVELTDTAKLGHKKRVRFKANKEAKKLYNEQIDKAKILTERATADTVMVYRIVNSAEKAYQQREHTPEMLDKALKRLRDSKNLLNENSFDSAQIKEHFNEYLILVKEFEYAAGAEGLADLQKEEIEEYRPVMEALKYRLQVYCEQNRIKLDGSVLGEHEEGSKLLKEDLDAWKNIISQFNEGNVFRREMPDEERLEVRERKAEVARPQAMMRHGAARLTKEQSMMTESDVKSQKKRDELRDLNFELYNMGYRKLAKVIYKYVSGTRYAVGYTEERKRLVYAKTTIDKLLKIRNLKKDFRLMLQRMQTYFNEVTNGTLVVPEDATILDFTEDKKIKEQGPSDGKGRSMMMNVFRKWNDESDTPLFSHEPVVNDLKQRLVSNCYMMASVAGIINVSPEILKGCLKDNGDGTVTVRLYEKELVPSDETSELEGKYKPVYIKVKKTVPRIAGADQLAAGALWMQMIEKAVAAYGRRKLEYRDDGKPGMVEKMEGQGYRSLWYGRADEFLQRLLGIPAYKGVSLVTKKQEDDFFEELLNIQNTKKVFHTGSNSRGVSNGLDTGHAYTIMGAEIINGERYVRMRNPYSNHSFQYGKNNKHSKAGTLTSFSNGSDETYGQFLIKYTDFQEEFSNISVSDLNLRVQN